MALTSKLEAIGDAIRSKTGKTEKLTLDEMPVEIEGIETDGIPEEALKLTGDCHYKFGNNNWNWFLEKYADRITTEDLTDISGMFDFCSECNITSIPFDLNVKSDVSKDFTSIFECMKIHTAPRINVVDGEFPVPTGKYNSTNLNLESIFNCCVNLREIPYDFFNNFISEEFRDATVEIGGGNRSKIFYCCESLRELPDLSRIHSGTTSASENFYNNGIYMCFSLNKVVNFPVQRVKYTSNMFPSTQATSYGNLGRIEDFTFEMQGDTPYSVEWAKQTINFDGGDTYGVAGTIPDTRCLDLLESNSGITEDKRVVTSEDYERLKHDPDWFTTDVAFSRYNRASAYRTLLSLPDASEYVASVGTPNTIKFRGNAGSLTDGQAINTMTEEEIAVATAKGFTVTFA